MLSVGFEGIVMINVDDAEDNFLCTLLFVTVFEIQKSRAI
jgi:hypothetical protein